MTIVSCDSSFFLLPTLVKRFICDFFRVGNIFLDELDGELIS